MFVARRTLCFAAIAIVASVILAGCSATPPRGDPTGERTCMASLADDLRQAERIAIGVHEQTHALLLTEHRRAGLDAAAPAMPALGLDARKATFASFRTRSTTVAAGDCRPLTGEIYWYVRPLAMSDPQAWSALWQPVEAHAHGISADTRQSLQAIWAEVMIWQFQNQWLRPPGLPRGLAARAQIVLLPNGEVVQATIAQGSGHSTFDASVVNAIYKASPVALPFAATAFNRVLAPTFAPLD